MTARILSVKKCEKLIIYTLPGHKSPVYGNFLKDSSLDCFTVGTDGEVKMWSCDTKLSEVDTTISDSSDKVKFRLTSKFTYRNAQDRKVPDAITCLSFHRKLQILATAFENGAVMLHQLPEFTLIDKTKYVAVTRIKRKLVSL